LVALFIFVLGFSQRRYSSDNVFTSPPVSSVQPIVSSSDNHVIIRVTKPTVTSSIENSEADEEGSKNRCLRCLKIYRLNINIEPILRLFVFTKYIDFKNYEKTLNS